MIQLLGEYECKLDAKARLRLPSDLLQQLGGEHSHNFVLNRGFEKCLVLYPETVWNETISRLNQMNEYSKKNRDFLRLFYRGAGKVERDTSDRILIPKRLLDFAGIDKDVVLSAINGKIEIWAKEIYDNLFEMDQDNFSELAEEVLGGLEKTFNQ